LQRGSASTRFPKGGRVAVSRMPYRGHSLLDAGGLARTYAHTPFQSQHLEASPRFKGAARPIRRSILTACFLVGHHLREQATRFSAASAVETTGKLIDRERDAPFVTLTSAAIIRAVIIIAL